MATEVTSVLTQNAGVSRRKIGVTLAFWVITLVTSVAIGFGLYRVFAFALGG